MPDWQERITHETEPAIRAEHDLRYALAAPLIIGGATWCDLGCGRGLAAAQALNGGFSGHALLVDRDEQAVTQAEAEIGAADTDAFTADLVVAGDLDRVRSALLDAAAPRTVTCFEVIEHLETFVPALELLLELAAEHETTVVLSVPNDAFWAIENPHHLTMWGEGAFAELSALLPDDHVVARQMALAGSAVVPGDGDGEAEVSVRLAEGVPTHFLVAFGSRAGDLRPAAAVAQVDLDAQRAWVRQRESDLAYTEAALLELQAWAEQHGGELEAWRTYIHELEDRLGLPRSGTPERAAHDEARAALPPGQ